jgi:Uma2 family endonuclease
MRMATKSRPWTRADLDRLPDDGNRYEVLDGALLVTPAPRELHQRVATRLSARLTTHCETHGLGNVYAYGAIPRGKSELQPDVMVVLGRIRRGGTGWSALPKPVLAVEILSDSTRGRDLVLKREAYLRWGIGEYWIVDPEARTVTVVRPHRADELHTETLVWQANPSLPPLVIDLATLFV